MDYTRQQMCGYKDYSAKTRTGNWREDVARDADRMREYIAKKATGELATQKRQRQIDSALVEVSLTPQRADKTVHFGDVLLLQSAETRGCLAVDVNTRVVGRPNHFNVSVSPGEVPVVRNAWTLAKTRDAHKSFYSEVGEVDVVHYGQQVRVVNRYAADANLNLCADLATPHNCLRGNTSGKVRSEVTVCMAGDLDTLWVVCPPDVAREVELQGQPVRSGDVVALKSVKSNQYLSAEQPRENMFGREHEVSTFHHKDTFSKQQQTLVGPRNLWGILCAPAGTPFVPFNPTRNADVVERVKAKILERGGGLGMRGLARSLRIMDDTGDRKLSRRELKEGLLTYGVHLTAGEMDVVFEEFDRNGDGVITVGEFLRTVRGEMNARRQNIVDEAFLRIDKDGSGVATFAELRSIYARNIHKHPDVEAGQKTPDEVIKEFVSGWDKSGDGNVTLAEFRDYYNDISCSIDSDDYFELMIRNAWHISGGEGWCENTTCRRVLVEHADGSQTVEEIENDLGIESDDIELMKERLIEQGITDIVRISLAD